MKNWTSQWGSALGHGVQTLSARIFGVGWLTFHLSAADPSASAQRLRDLPQPPLPPVAQFTQLSEATPEERMNQLASRPVRARELILTQLAQFDALSGAKREQRILQLRVAQLRFFLAPLLRAPVERRSALLGQVPTTDLAFIESRLAIWDTLSATAQQEVLDSEQALRHFVNQTAPPTSLQLTNALAQVPAILQLEVLQEFQHWLALTPDERKQRTSNFNRFFDLTPDEQTRVLGTLTEVERRRMEQSLGHFNALPREKRELCIKNFDRLARLSEGERAEFLENAAKWKAMSKSERDAWRRLLLPPFPPLPPIPSDPLAHQN